MISQLTDKFEKQKLQNTVLAHPFSQPACLQLEKKEKKKDGGIRASDPVHKPQLLSSGLQRSEKQSFWEPTLSVVTSQQDHDRKKSAFFFLQTLPYKVQTAHPSSGKFPAGTGPTDINYANIVTSRRDYVLSWKMILLHTWYFQGCPGSFRKFPYPVFILPLWGRRKALNWRE